MLRHFVSCLIMTHRLLMIYFLHSTFYILPTYCLLSACVRTHGSSRISFEAIKPPGKV